jgi:hypothetical protein
MPISTTAHFKYQKNNLSMLQSKGECVT